MKLRKSLFLSILVLTISTSIFAQISQSGQNIQSIPWQQGNQGQVVVSGVVTDEAGEPLIGVVVSCTTTTVHDTPQHPTPALADHTPAVHDTPQTSSQSYSATATPTALVSTITDLDGAYSIEVPRGATLKFQLMGYENYEWVVEGAPVHDALQHPTPALADPTPAVHDTPQTPTTTPKPQPTTVHDALQKVTHNVTLLETSTALEETIVVAYGVKKKGTITGSVAMVKAQSLSDVPAASFDQALQGKATGLSVLSSSGEPSATPQFQIRGVNSINSGTAPLFILDGMQISASDFNAISPNDIESVSVLKDASSTSIYGARAANGVVVITTKRGRQAEDAKITFRTQLGFSQLASEKWNLMNTAERILYEQEIGLTEGQDYKKLSQIDVNWLNVVFNKFAPLQSYELQASGATNRINYYVSGGYFKQQGITSDSDFSRVSLRTNLEFDANKWLKIGTNILLAYETYAESMAGEYTINTPISASRFMLPYWNPYQADGKTLASINDGSWKGLGENPLEWCANNPYNTKKYKALANVFLEINPIKNLVIKSLVGVDYTHGAVQTFSYASYKPNNGQGRAARNSSDAFNLTITNTATYKFDINKTHNFNFMLGQEGLKYTHSGFSVSTAGQNNYLLYDVSFATRATSWSSTSTAYSYLSFFGRAEYDFDQRIYADVSLRADGSSRFGAKGRWAAFWSAGLMWNLRNEDFMKITKNWLTTAQIAASVGTSGNSSIPNYQHFALVGGGKDYLGDAGIGPSSKGNENLKWEKTLTSNLAFHLGFWNRLTADLELYHKKTSDMLMSVPVSYAQDGFGYRWDNVGGMENMGVELNLSGEVLRRGDFLWNINANFSYNYNRITELYNGVSEYVVSTTGTKLVVGHSIGEFYMNRFAGVNPINGDALWYTKDGEITNVFEEKDKVLIGQSYIAPWQGGFGTVLSYKGLALSAQFSWVLGRYMINNDRYFEEGGGNFDVYNQSRRMLYDRWKKPGDVTDVPRHGVSPQFDTHLLEDASFLRLKNLQISYNVPQEALTKTRFFKGVKVYLQGQNLFTVTPFSGLDPESPSNVYAAQYPMTRQYTFGIELSF